MHKHPLDGYIGYLLCLVDILAIFGALFPLSVCLVLSLLLKPAVSKCALSKCPLSPMHFHLSQSEPGLL